MTALQIDVTGVLLTGLRAQLGSGYRCVVETPDDLAQAVPVVKVNRAGGGDDGRVLDTATMIVEVFAAGAAPGSGDSGARAAAYTVAGAMYSLRGQVYNGAVIVSVRKLGGPTPLPYANTAVRRQSLTFRVGIKPA